MGQSSIRILLALVVLVLTLMQSASAQQTSASFAAAFANRSTSPRYVLITIINDKTGSQQTICTLATFFDGAIHYQYHLPYTAEGERKSRKIALTSSGRTYHFSQSNALRNLRIRYTPQILIQVRSQLKNVSTSTLVKGLSHSGKMNEIYTKQKSFGMFAAYRDALAYVLIERGLQPEQADMTGGLYLAR